MKTTEHGHGNRGDGPLGRVVAAALLLLCAASVAGAAESGTLHEVVVEAERTAEAETTAEDPAGFVTVIPVKEHERTLSTVPQVLEESVGLTVRRFGGLGAFSTASIRGSSAEQVTILLDGVPLNRGKSGAVNLSTLPLRSLEKVEVYRGVSPLRFRSSAVGGVINLVTKSPEEEPAFDLGASYGSFGTYESTLTGSGRSGRTGWLLSADLMGSDGDFGYLDDNGTRVNPDDDVVTKRKNNHFDSQSLLAKLNFAPAPETKIEFLNDFFHKFEGVPGLGAFQSETADLDTLRNVTSLKLRRDGWLSPAFSAEGGAWLLYEKTGFRDLLGEIGTGRQDNRNETIAFGLDAHGEYFLGDRQRLSLVLSARHERFDSEDRLSSLPEGDTQRRNVFRFGVDDEISLLEDRLVLLPQLLYTYLQNDFGGSLPFAFGPLPEKDDDDFLSSRLGARCALGGGWSLRGNAGRYFRYPNFSELFGDRGGVIGNPDLAPEEGINADIGISFEGRDLNAAGLVLDRLFLEAVFFYSEVDDLILFVQTSQRTVKAENVSSAETRGIEASWAATFFRHLEISGNYTWMDAVNTSDISYLNGKRLPGRPEHELFNRAALFNRWGRIFWEYNHIADNFLDQANFEKVKSRSIHNLGITLGPWRKMTATFEVKNLGDEQVADVMGFPLPGRSYMGTVTAKF